MYTLLFSYEHKRTTFFSLLFPYPCIIALVTASETAVFMSVISDIVGSSGIINAATAILAKASFCAAAEKLNVILFFKSIIPFQYS